MLVAVGINGVAVGGAVGGTDVLVAIIATMVSCASTVFAATVSTDSVGVRVAAPARGKLQALNTNDASNTQKTSLRTYDMLTPPPLVSSVSLALKIFAMIFYHSNTKTAISNSRENK